MKRFFKLAPHAKIYMLACVISLGTTGIATRAQNVNLKTVRTRPVQTKVSVDAHADPQSQVSQIPREQRSQAYAKLLEGQRYYAGAITGRVAVGDLKIAQQSFQQAAELDPTLAEAHTALAEMAFFFFEDLPLAVREATTAINTDRNNLGAHRVLARVLTIQSKFTEKKLERLSADQAITELREVLRLRSSDAEAWALLAELYLASGRETDAIEALRTWATLPTALESRFYQVVTKGRELTPATASARLAEVLLRAGRMEESIVAIRRAMALEPDNPRHLGLLSEALEASGIADQGLINDLRRLVTQNPKNTAAVRTLARAQVRAHQLDDAVATFRQGIDAYTTGDRERLSLQLQLAQTYADALRADEAIAIYEELLKSRSITDSTPVAEKDRNFAASLLTRILNLQQRAEQNDKSLATIERTRRLLGDKDPTADLLKVNFLRVQRKRDEALLAIRDARQRFPEDVRLLNLEAMVLADLGRVDEALGIIRPGLKNSPDDYNQYLLIASILTEVGRADEAVEAARKALELSSSEVPELGTQALLLLASAQERAGDAKGAEETLRRILITDPNNPTALNNLGYFLAERNERLPEALQLIQRAVRAEPSNASFIDSLGWIYFKLGQLKDAERYLNEATHRNPSSATVQEHLGDLLQHLGKTEQSRAAWQKALTFSTTDIDKSRLKTKLNGESLK